MDEQSFNRVSVRADAPDVLRITAPVDLTLDQAALAMAVSRLSAEAIVKHPQRERLLELTQQQRVPVFLRELTPHPDLPPPEFGHFQLYVRDGGDTIILLTAPVSAFFEVMLRLHEQDLTGE